MSRTFIQLFRWSVIQMFSKKLDPKFTSAQMALSATGVKGQSRGALSSDPKRR
jgi:hypothetical protein